MCLYIKEDPATTLGVLHAKIEIVDGGNLTIRTSRGTVTVSATNAGVLAITETKTGKVFYLPELE